MATFFVYAGVEVVVAQWSFTLLTLQRGESVATGSLLVGLFWGSLMVGRVLFGVVVLTVGLLALYRVVVGWGRRGGVAVGGR